MKAVAMTEQIGPCKATGEGIGQALGRELVQGEDLS